MANLYIRYPTNSGGGGGLSSISFFIGTFDSQTPNANGGSVSSSTIYFQASTATLPGMVSSNAQTFAGVKTFSSAPLFSSVLGPSPLRVTVSGQATAGSVSLSSEVSGSLPIAQTSGSVSLVNQVVGNLPLAQTSGSISLTNQVSGVLPFTSVSGSVSLVNQVVGNLPLSQTSGSISLTAQVSGNLPISQTSGSVSLTNKVVGSLPLSQTTGSISLTAQIFGLLPIANGGATGSNTGDISVAAFGASPNSSGGTIGAGQVLTLQPADATNPGGISTGTQTLAGAKSFSTSIASPTHIVGSVTFANSSTGGSAYSVVMPGAQGGSSTVLFNDGAGKLSWATSLTNPMTTSGDIIVGSGTGTAARLAGSVSNSVSFLTQTGAAGASALPVWSTIRLPTIQRFTTVGSANYTATSGATWIKIKMAGGGGGGASGQASVGANAGTAGSATTFGTTFLSAGPGLAADTVQNAGTCGSVTSSGTSTVLIFAFIGGTGTGGGNTGGLGGTPQTALSGGNGGNNFLGGSGGGGKGGAGTGANGAPNTGGGGGGGGCGSNNGAQSGGGGGASGYLEVMLISPAASYPLIIGAGGPGGAATTACGAGGNGGSGVIVVEEYFM